MAFHSLSAQVSCFEFNKLTRWKNKTHIPRPSAKLPLSVPGRCFPAPKCSKTCGYSRLVTQPWGPVSLATDYIVKSIQGASIIFCTTSDWDLSTCWASSDSQPAESHCHSHTWHQLASYRLTFDLVPNTVPVLHCNFFVAFFTTFVHSERIPKKALR